MDRLPLQILRSDALARSGVDATALARLARRQILHRISAGRYADTRDWATLDELERHRLLVMAIASTTASDPVFSHHAAAALWRIPLLGHWPSKIDVTVPSATGGRSSGQIRRHCRASFPPPLAQIDGMLVTTLARTAADLARALPFRDGVAVLDAVLSPRFGDHETTRASIAAELRSGSGGRGVRTARAGLDFATHLSESVWESASRVVLHQLGFPPPVLQQEFRWSSRNSYRVDFWWPQFRIIGEFDGLVKYGTERDESAASGREALVREKVREDRLRALSSGFARWTAADVREPARLADILRRAGLRPTR
jgi:hypothetical protein